MGDGRRIGRMIGRVTRVDETEHGVASQRMRRSGGRSRPCVGCVRGACPFGSPRLPGVVTLRELRWPGRDSSDRRRVDRHQQWQDSLPRNRASSDRDAHGQLDADTWRAAVEFVGVPGHGLQQHRAAQAAPLGIGAHSVDELVRPEGPALVAARQRCARETAVADPCHGRPGNAANQRKRSGRPAPAWAARLHRAEPPEHDRGHALDRALAPPANDPAAARRRTLASWRGVVSGRSLLACSQPQLLGMACQPARRVRAVSRSSGSRRANGTTRSRSSTVGSSPTVPPRPHSSLRRRRVRALPPS